MNGILKKVLTYFVLPIVIIALVFFIYESIMAPVKFNKQMNYRESVGIQRLKDIRTLEVAYKSVNNRFTASMDTLIDFYNTGKMKVIMQVGSRDDSAAVANTEKIKKAKRGITPDQLYKMYKNGEDLVFSISSEIPVRDTLFRTRKNFSVDSLRTIPFSGGDPVETNAIIKKVSGVDVPLFEASMPYKLLLKGLDNQLRINVDAKRIDQNRYPGLQVGSITAPNNNAGNWE
ncbi:MAG: hypothetical protein LKI59_04660 [Bacteroidales bacterium]|jgi:hypothetical protein|nr:hypothetical protein [Bacteroidales bacterium]